MEVLRLLREYTIKGKPIKYDTSANAVFFDDVSFPKDSETSFKGQNGKFYKLEDVWFCLQHRDKQWIQYVKECNQFKFGIVAFLDHKDLINYLTGKIETSAKIDKDHVARVAAASSASSAATNVLPSTPAAPLPSTATTSALPPASGFNAPLPVQAQLQLGNAPSAQSLLPQAGGLPPAVTSGTAASSFLPPQQVPAEPEQPARPLTEAERRAQQRKKMTMQRDEEEILKIGEAREMKLKEILADADEVDDIRRHERSVKSREEVLRSTTHSYKNILNLMQLRHDVARNLRRPPPVKPGMPLADARAAQQKRERPRSSSSSAPASASARPADPKKARSGKVPIPVIIVPAASTSNMTVYNAKEFFELGQWVAPLKKRESMKGTLQSVADQKVRFLRQNIGGDDATDEHCMFEVVDNTRNFTSDDWARVVAVFTNGKEWEFKGWKLGDPATIFNRVCGFYLAFRGEPVPPSVTAWNVKVLWLEKNSRHMDVIAAKTFWSLIDKEVPKRQPALRIK